MSGGLIGVARLERCGSSANSKLLPKPVAQLRGIIGRVSDLAGAVAHRDRCLDAFIPHPPRVADDRGQARLTRNTRGLNFLQRGDDIIRDAARLPPDELDCVYSGIDCAGRETARGVVSLPLSSHVSGVGPVVASQTPV